MLLPQSGYCQIINYQDLSKMFGNSLPSEQLSSRIGNQLAWRLRWSFTHPADNLQRKVSKWLVSKLLRSLQHSKQYLDRVKQIWYLSPMRAAKVQAILRICAVLPEPPLLAHTSSESRGTFRQKARSLAPLNGWACAVKICHDGMLEDANSLDGAHFE